MRTSSGTISAVTLLSEKVKLKGVWLTVSQLDATPTLSPFEPFINKLTKLILRKANLRLTLLLLLLLPSQLIIVNS